MIFLFFFLIGHGSGLIGSDRRDLRQSQPLPPQQSFIQDRRCADSKDSGFQGSAQSPLFRYYFSREHLQCLGFMYYGHPPVNSNNFGSLHECEDVCLGQRRIHDLNLGCLKTPSSCQDFSCPWGFECDRDRALCCNQSLSTELSVALGTNLCRNSRSFSWLSQEDELPILGASCNDLPCPSGFSCEQISASFAQCCETGDQGFHQSQPTFPDPPQQQQGLLPLPPIPNCDLPSDPGRCGPGERGREETRWYFNRAKGLCLAFTHTGCSGGNGNTYPSKAHCEEFCVPQDGSACYGGPGIADSVAPTVSGQTCDDQRCPFGYVCSMGFQFPSCCNATIQDMYEEAYDRRCPRGEPAHGRHNGEYWEAFIGDSCRFLSCPAGFQCRDVNRLFAKCCESGPSEILPPTNRALLPPAPPRTNNAPYQPPSPPGPPAPKNDINRENLIHDSGPVVTGNGDCPAGESEIRERGNILSCNRPDDCPTWGFCRQELRDRPGICCSPPTPFRIVRLIEEKNCTSTQQASLNTCFLPLANTTRLFIASFGVPFAGTASLADFLSVVSVSRLCQEFRDYNMCNREPCFYGGDLFLKAIMNYLCRADTMTVLRTSSACLSSSLFRNDMRLCGFTKDRNITDENGQCEAIYDELSCIMEVVLEHCPRSMATLVEQFLLVLDKSFYNPSCQILPPGYFNSSSEKITFAASSNNVKIGTVNVIPRGGSVTLNLSTQTEFVPPFLARLLAMQNCSKEQDEGIKFCLAPFEEKAHISALTSFSKLMSFIPRNDDIREFDETCAIYRSYGNCTAVVFERGGFCWNFLDGFLRQTLGYVCQVTNRNILLDGLYCLSIPPVEAKLAECSAALDKVVESFGQRVAQPLNDLCLEMELLLRCAEPAVNASCRPDFAHVFFQLLSNLRQASFGPFCGELKLPRLTPQLNPSALFPGCSRIEASTLVSCIEEFRRNSNFDTTAPHILLSKDQIRQLPGTCRAFRAYQDCASIVRNAKCRPPFTGTIMGPLSVHCSRGVFTGWAQHGPCLADTGMDREVRDCLSFGDLDNCGGRLMECVKDPVRRICGVAAADFVARVALQLSQGCNASSTKCVNERNRMIAGGNSVDQFVPDCQINGDYEQKQCDQRASRCWCVDVKTGIEIAGSQVFGSQDPFCGSKSNLKSMEESLACFECFLDLGPG